MPVTKEPGVKVIGGTMDHSGSLISAYLNALVRFFRYVAIKKGSGVAATVELCAQRALAYGSRSAASRRGRLWSWVNSSKRQHRRRE